jgi:NAD+--asparagine ADP-ribosyltransferase
MGKEIRIIKKDDQKKFEDHTFIDNNIELKKLGNENDSNPSSSNDKKYRECVFKLRNNPKKDMKSQYRSQLVRRHGTQSHSPVYE